MSPMSLKDRNRPVRILLVEDNYGDVLLTQQAFSQSTFAHELNIARDGEEAMQVLHREGAHAGKPLPDIILLDLNLPKMDGKEVLAAIKGNEALRHIPVIILTSSKAEQDVVKSYSLNANSYMVKPVDLDAFMQAVKAIEQFWVNLAVLLEGSGA